MRKTDTPALVRVRAALQMIGVEPGVLGDASIRDSVRQRLCSLVAEVKSDGEKPLSRGQAESYVMALAAEAGVSTREGAPGRSRAFADDRLTQLLQRCLTESFGEALA